MNCFGRSLALLFSLLGLIGCSTTGYFKIPKGTTLEVYERHVVPDATGRVEMRPMFWTSAGGTKYRLLKDGKVLQEGKVRSKFRVVSIFWPPFALIYWPMGLNGNVLNDMSDGKTNKEKPLHSVE